MERCFDSSILKSRPTCGIHCKSNIRQRWVGKILYTNFEQFNLFQNITLLKLETYTYSIDSRTNDKFGNSLRFISDIQGQGQGQAIEKC